MRLVLSIVFSLLIVALLVCLVLSKRSKKAVGNSVAFLLSTLVVPVLGNLILVVSTDKLISSIGCYLYFLGLDMVVYSLWRFTHVYCDMGKPKRGLHILVLSLLGLDVIQYALNPFFRFTFSIERIIVEDKPYYRLIPYFGQTYHRVVCYGLFLLILIIFIAKLVTSSKIYADKYRVILFSMLITCIVESYYVFSRQPLDMSMIGFAVSGLLVYFFAIFYRPMKLLDRILAGMASDMPDALFFFDKNNKCIWINEPGKKLIGISKDNYENVKENLKFLFDDIDLENTGWVRRVKLGSGDEAMYTHLAMRSVVDEKGKITGSYLSARDITEEQREIKRDMYRSTHDLLTDLYTKEFLYGEIEKRLAADRETGYMIC